MLLDGRAQESGIPRRGSDATMLIVYNAHHDVVPFRLPDVADGRHWMGLIDTAQPDSELATHSLGHVYEVTGRSLCAFALATEGALSSDLRYGVGSILEVTERPLD
jgi:isoamylase